MAHCPYDQLADLEDILAVIRTWVDVSEPKPGIFYVRRIPFLHFHLKDDHRWADVRDGKDWGASIDIPPCAPARAKQKFLRAVERCRRATCGAFPTKRRLSERPFL